MTGKGYTFCYYVSGHGFGHATRVNQIITELLQSKTVVDSFTAVSDPVLTQLNTVVNASGTTEIMTTTTTTLVTTTTTTTTTTTATTPDTTANGSMSRHTIYIVSDAPQFIFQDVIALGAIYRNAKVDAGVVQPLAYSVDRQKTIEGVKSFLARREEMIRHEVSWLQQVGANCVLADAPFLPCAAAHAYGIPACLITNFTFDEVYRFLREGNPMDRDVIACADAALEDYKKASLLLRLPGSIDIPAFADEISMLENRPTIQKLSCLNADDTKETMGLQLGQQNADHDQDRELHLQHLGATNGTLNGEQQGQQSRKNPQLSVITSVFRAGKPGPLQRRVIDVPLVVRKAINSREDVLRSLGVDEETIKTKKMVLVSFGGQRLKQGWGNPLPEGWIGVICGLPVSHELPDGFYRSPHGVYVPDLTHAADIVIGKLGYGTCSECIAHDTPLIYVSRPQFIEEQGLIKLMINHGLPVEMTAEEFETGLWQRSILEADRLAEEEREGRKLFLGTCDPDTAAAVVRRRRSSAGFSISSFASSSSTSSLHRRASKVKSLAESVNMGEMARGGPISPPVNDEDSPMLSPARSRRRSASISSLTSATIRSKVMNTAGNSSAGNGTDKSARVGNGSAAADGRGQDLVMMESESPEPAAWFERRIPHDGGKVCAQLVEEYMRIWDEYGPRRQ